MEGIQFIEKGKGQIYIKPENILMLTTMEHWVYTHVLRNNQIIKVERHCSLSEILNIINNSYIKRMGKFCAVNFSYQPTYLKNVPAFEFLGKFTLTLDHPIPMAELKKHFR
jgi:hypothetical protein